MIEAMRNNFLQITNAVVGVGEVNVIIPQPRRGQLPHGIIGKGICYGAIFPDRRNIPKCVIGIIVRQTIQ